MKKILIFVDKIGPKKELFAEEIAKKLGKGKQLVLARFTDLYFDIDPKNISIEVGKIPITDFSLVYFRRAGDKFSVASATLALCLAQKGIKFVDSVWGEIGPLGSKFTSLVKLAIAGLPIFHTIFVQQSRIEDFKAKIVKNLGFPLVAKEVSTQRGKGVHKIESKEDFDKLPAIDSEGRTNQFLFQKFTEIKEEYRLLVLRDRVRVWEKKIVTDPNEFRHNIALGATEEFLDIKDIPEEFEKIAVKAARALKLEVAGVDIAVEAKTGKLFLIEVNRGPGITYDMDVSPELHEIAAFLDRESD